LHEHCFHTLQIPHLQLDELRTRLRCAKEVLWLWLAIDPLTKIIPVLELGPRTQTMAHQLIHSLQQSLAAFLSSALYQRWVKCVLLCGSRLTLASGSR
jgi:IS1 family transposase